MIDSHASKVYLSREYAEILPKNFLQTIRHRLVFVDSPRMSLPRYIVTIDPKVFSEARSPAALVEKVAQKIAGVKNVLVSETEEEGVPGQPSSLRQVVSISREVYETEQKEVPSAEYAHIGPSVRPFAGLTSIPVELVVTTPSDNLGEDSSLLHSQTLPSLLFTPTTVKEQYGGLQSLLRTRQTPLGEETTSKEDSFWHEEPQNYATPSSPTHTSYEILPGLIGRTHKTEVPTLPTLKGALGAPSLEVTGRHFKLPPALEIHPKLAKYHERYGALPPLQGRPLPVHSLESSDSLLALTLSLPATSGRVETEGEPKDSSLADSFGSSLLAVPEEHVMDWYAKSVAEGNVLQNEQAPPPSLPTIQQSKRSFYFAAKLSSMPVAEELANLEVEKIDTLGSPATLRDSLATTRSSTAFSMTRPNGNILQAARNLLEFDKNTMQKGRESRKREVRRQLRMNRIIQYLRKKLKPTELAELFSDLYTNKPSKRTELLLEETGKIVDAYMK
ncbi:unnamed protein product [Dibothriocephalus latus]|uniref:Uncharacterized protein n=1 Tax=Dibothriocephalus latus TaxID=60516 RepID=A0A3P7NRH9_DIBLA|nr:unnamed protein product [Dibothriocephalus latus]